MSSVIVVACAGHGSSSSQADTLSNTHGRCNAAVQSQLDYRQIEPEQRAVLPVAALQLHVTDHPPCTGGGCNPSQTEAPIDATRVAMKPVLYSSMSTRVLVVVVARVRLMRQVMPRSLQWRQILLRLSQSCGQCYL